jgi:hypothetical protein
MGVEPLADLTKSDAPRGLSMVLVPDENVDVLSHLASRYGVCG